MIIVDVGLGDRAYSIHIGLGLLSRAELLAPYIRGACVVTITNEAAAPLYAARVGATIRLLGKAVDTAVLPGGELLKKWDTLNRIFDTLLTVGANRRTMPIALGGGVVDGMTGFTVACYMRDVPFIQVPTTPPSQVDLSVDGKTGISYPLGKSMIGALHQPQVVLADIDTPRMSPVRGLMAGTAEVIKHDAIADADYFVWIEQNIRGFNDYDTDLMAKVVCGSVCVKAVVVTQDERETGLCAIPNLGHTSGYAIEAGLGYGEWLHGEAASCSMVMAVDLLHQPGLIDTNTYNRVTTPTRTTNLLTVALDLGADRFVDPVRADKKAEAGEIKLMPLRKLGQTFTTAVLDADLCVTLQRAVS